MTRLTRGVRKHSIASLLTPACLHLPLLCIWPLISFEIICEIRTQCVFCPLINFISHQSFISNPFPRLSFTTNKLEEEVALHQILTAASLTLFCFVFGLTLSCFLWTLHKMDAITGFRRVWSGVLDYLCTSLVYKVNMGEILSHKVKNPAFISFLI